MDAVDARGSDLVLVAPEDEALDDLRALANQAPVIKLVNLMILEALRARASDIHLETVPDGLRVRYRVDGVLQEISHPPRHYQAAVISRIKIMAGLNIAERRLAQDGRIRLRLSDRELDLRVSTLPRCTAKASCSASSTAARACGTSPNCGSARQRAAPASTS